MRKKVALIIVLSSVFILINLYPIPISSKPVIYSPSTHGNGGV
ncbi:hypothetical protein J3D43_002827 [Paenibacillus xylanexedens]|nr:hypothetical protein [Paenibacillus xylanexedens]